MNNEKIKKVEDSVLDAVDFFNNEIIQNPEPIDNFNFENNLNKIKEDFLQNENYITELNDLRKQKEQLISENEQYKSIIKNLETKVTELDELYEKEKTKIVESKESEIEKLKSDVKKHNKEKESLIKLCTNLKIEVNRLENSLEIAQNIIQSANNMEYYEYNENQRKGEHKYNERKLTDNDITQSLNYSKNLNVNDINLIKEKTNQIIKESNIKLNTNFNGNINTNSNTSNINLTKQNNKLSNNNNNIKSSNFDSHMPKLNLKNINEIKAEAKMQAKETINKVLNDNIHDSDYFTDNIINNKLNEIQADSLRNYIEAIPDESSHKLKLLKRTKNK